MYNVGLTKIKNLDINNFTTTNGLKLRRTINPIFRKVLKLATKRKIVLESYPQLEDNTAYIFASTHSFDEDVISSLALIDRNAYLLAGTTDQIEHNPQMYAAWINGMIYIDRLNKKSRSESIGKMEKVINAGNSILMFPEGGWNNTENLLVQPLFAGVYIVAKNTNTKVVPVASFNDPGSNTIYTNFGNPIDFSNKSKKEALTSLRDELASMTYKHIEKYAEPIVRDALTDDYRIKYMETRKNEYMRVNWSRDVWDEELAFYFDKEITTPEEVRKSLDEVVITSKNANIMAPILQRRLEDDKYNFKNYMHENWNKRN